MLLPLRSTPRWVKRLTATFLASLAGWPSALAPAMARWRGVEVGGGARVLGCRPCHPGERHGRGASFFRFWVRGVRGIFESIIIKGAKWTGHIHHYSMLRLVPVVA
jgi:hypothetical protein